MKPVLQLPRLESAGQPSPRLYAPIPLPPAVFGQIRFPRPPAVFGQIRFPRHPIGHFKPEFLDKKNKVTAENLDLPAENPCNEIKSESRLELPAGQLPLSQKICYILNRETRMKINRKMVDSNTLLKLTGIQTAVKCCMFNKNTLDTSPTVWCNVHGRDICGVLKSSDSFEFICLEHYQIMLQNNKFSAVCHQQTPEIAEWVDSQLEKASLHVSASVLPAPAKEITPRNAPQKRKNPTICRDDSICHDKECSEHAPKSRPRPS